MNQMNQIERNKQQNTQKNAKKDSCSSCNPLATIIHCASHLVHPVRLVTKKKDSCSSCSPLATKKISLLKHKLIINL